MVSLRLNVFQFACASSRNVDILEGKYLLERDGPREIPTTLLGRFRVLRHRGTPRINRCLHKGRNYGISKLTLFAAKTYLCAFEASYHASKHDETRTPHPPAGPDNPPVGLVDVGTH